MSSLTEDRGHSEMEPKGLLGTINNQSNGDHLNIMDARQSNGSPETPSHSSHNFQDVDRLNSRDLESVDIEDENLDPLDKNPNSSFPPPKNSNNHDKYFKNTNHRLEWQDENENESTDNAFYNQHQNVKKSKPTLYVVPTNENALGPDDKTLDKDISKISAYARLDFESFTFFVQTLQVVLGRKSNDDLLQSSHHAVDVHLSGKKAISRRHAKIFYNFGTQRFEISILGRNGAFVDDLFVEKGITVPLIDGTKIQIGDIPFTFVLPSIEPIDENGPEKQFNPSDAINLKSNFSSTTPSTPKKSNKKVTVDIEESRKSIQRRVSVSRRKSIATASIEEINDIMAQLGPELDNLEDDAEFLDAQIEAILNDHSRRKGSTVIDLENDPDIIKFEEFSRSEIKEDDEDEIDQLVKQHNLSQGVSLENDKDDTSNLLSGLDQEIASLAPLIDAHQQEIERSSYTSNKKAPPPFTIHQPPPRPTPLMGKPANAVNSGPRMGRPAAIQPPSSRMYGRPAPKAGNSVSNSIVNNIVGYGSYGGINNGRLTTSTNPLAGLPTHLVASSAGFPLKVAHGTLHRPLPPRPVLEVQLSKIDPNRYDRAPKKTSLKNPIKILDACRPKKYDNLNFPAKNPRRRRDNSNQIKKASKKVYTLDEIPEQYRMKPTLSYPLLITNVLKTKGSVLTATEISDGIKETYPYYKYCADGWQASVCHNLILNRIFKKVENKNGENVNSPQELAWTIDDMFIKEREKVRLKQQELITAKAKEAALKAEEWKQKQRLEGHQSATASLASRYNSLTGFGSGLTGLGSTLGGFGGLGGIGGLGARSQFMSQLQGAKPKTIAELASEIRRDGASGNGKTPMYFKPQESSSTTSSSSIKDQLAANRASASASPTTSSPGIPSVNTDTKKSLAYLQKELFTLYKMRKLSYNTATTTEIITKALATTIAQVNVIGAKAGCGDNALGFLVEKAPQQVSKILDIALSKSIKEREQGGSGLPSRVGTPVQSGNITKDPPKTVVNTISSPAASNNNTVSLQTTANSITPTSSKPDIGSSSSSSATPTITNNIVHTAPKPASTTIQRPGVLKPPSFKSENTHKGGSLGKPPSFASGHVGSLGKPPSFISNKPPSRPVFQKPEMKREIEDTDEASHKRIKID